MSVDVNDEISLKPIFVIVKQNKVMISILFLLTICLSSFHQISNYKTYKYKGILKVSLGLVKTANGMVALESLYNLKYVLNNELKNIQYPVKIKVPKGTNRILEFSFRSNDKTKILEVLDKTYEYILEREKTKLSFFENGIASKKIGNIEVFEIDTKLSKIMTKSFVLGIFVCIFFIIIKLFLNKGKNQNEKI